MPPDDLLNDALRLRRATADEIIPLRHAALRQGLPRSEAMFDGDDAPTSRHYAASRGAEVIGCATVHWNEWEGRPAWQLRGMATADGFRRQGIGRHLLRFLEEDLASDFPSPVSLWCNARTPAIPFYAGQGWAVRSAVFDIPTAGPHVKMFKSLSENVGR